MADASDVDARLLQGIRELGIDVNAGARQRLLEFLALLAKWNNVYNLTAIRDPADMLPVHLFDSLSIMPIIDRLGVTSVIDVGSGAGLPGIPLAIARDGLSVRSVDAVAKKIGFQLQVKTALSLDRFYPLHRRIEEVDPTEVPDLIVSRAFADIPKMLAAVAHLTGPQTTVLAMKGAVPGAEIDALPNAWRLREIVELDVPSLGARRCAVLLNRAAGARSD